MGVAIRLRDITFRYDGAKENVLEHIDLDIAYGELVLLSGLSGEGKSTLLSIINGVIPFVNGGKCTGTVEIDGRDLTRQSRPGGHCAAKCRRADHLRLCGGRDRLWL